MIKVVKFGGSSLADAVQIKKAGKIVLSEESRRYVVPSAPGKRFSDDTKVTDMLYRCYGAAVKEKKFTELLADIQKRYQEIIEGLGITLSLDEEFATIRDNFAKKIGRDIEADFEQLKLTGGYDHNFCIDDWDGSLKHIATAKGPKSGRVMKVYTTLPGVQFYAGNFIAPEEGKAGAVYDNRTGFALETQNYPDTIHH